MGEFSRMFDPMGTLCFRDVPDCTVASGLGLKNLAPSRSRLSSLSLREVGRLAS